MTALLATRHEPSAQSAPQRFTGPVGYGSVTPLDRQRHASHGVRLPHSYAWCSQTKAVPINVEEFAVAALQMPIAFVIDATGRHDVAAVLALHGDRNAFVDPDGRWLAEHYVPAYLRRFPFCSFVHGAAAQTNAPIVCVQEAALEADSRTPLINGNGELTEYWKPWAQLIDHFENGRAHTLRFISRLTDLDLLVPFDAVHMAPDGRRHTLAGLYRVDEARLATMTAGILREMFQSGEMRAIYMHLLSLENLKQIRRADAP